MSKKGAFGGVILAALLVGGLVTAFACTEKIKPGYVGVVYNVNNGVDGEVIGKGWHLVAPTKKVTQYSVALEQSYLTAEDKGDSPKDESFNTPTSDGKSLLVDLEFSYRFDPDRITNTFEMFKGKDGDTIKDTFIKPKMKAWTQEVTAKYPVTDVFGDKRQELNEALDVYLKQKFNPYGIIIDTVNFTSIKTDEKTNAAIQKKVDAQQAQELANIEAKTAKINANKEKEVALINAEKDKETAKISAEQAKIKAEGQAEATRIKAEVEAEAITKVSNALTDGYVDYTEAQKWDGKLPTVNGASGTIIDMGNINSKENQSVK